jgi:cytochrome c oxidase subunit IV
VLVLVETIEQLDALYQHQQHRAGVVFRFRVSGLVFRISGLVFRVSGFGLDLGLLTRWELCVCVCVCVRARARVCVCV